MNDAKKTKTVLRRPWHKDARWQATDESGRVYASRRKPKAGIDEYHGGVWDVPGHPYDYRVGPKRAAPADYRATLRKIRGRDE
jgi:hypothetical protein